VVAVVFADQATQDHASLGCEVHQSCVQNVTADVLENQVDTTRCGLRYGCRQLSHVLAAIVDSNVVVIVLDQPPAFLRPAGYADRPATFEGSDLSGDGAHRPGRAGDEHGLARLRVPHLE